MQVQRRYSKEFVSKAPFSHPASIKTSTKHSSDNTAAVGTYKNTLVCEKPAVVSYSENVQVHYHWLPCVL